VKFDILTVVPEAVEGYLQASILGRAQARGDIQCSVTNLRSFGTGPHRQLDDSPYGGGSGMVMQPGPIVDAIEAARGAAAPDSRLAVLLMSPAGRRLDQKLAGELAEDYDHLVLVCGRYEGIDARVLPFVDMELSLGDFVITGGELAALSVIDSVARLRPRVLGNEDSSREESFQGATLEYPQYTRPASFRGLDVPPVLLSGDHQRVRRWRQDAALERTRKMRPDLLETGTGFGNSAAEMSKGLDSGDLEE